MSIKTSNCSIAELIQQRDWSASALGQLSTWPPKLQHAVEFILSSKFPIFMVWGEQLTFLYNEAYMSLLGDKHPGALGRPFPQVWEEIWSDVAPLVARTFAGESLYFEDQPFLIHRNGRKDQIWVTFSYAPLYDENDEVAGLYCVVNDTTQRVLIEKRQVFQLKLTDKLRALAAPQDITYAASQMLGEYFSVGRVGYAEIDLDKDIARVHRDWTNGIVPTLAGEARPLSGFGPAIITALKSGETLVIDDVTTDARSASYALAYASIGVSSAIVVPLLENGRLTAALHLHESVPKKWTNEERGVVEDTARRTWETIKRARVEEALRDETRILEILNETGQTLASTLDLRTLLQSITDAATSLSGANFGSFFYTDKDDQGEALLLYTLSGAPREAFEKFGKPRATALFGPTFQGHVPIRSDDILNDERYGKMSPHHGMPKGHLPVRSYLATSVKSRSGEVIGGLFFGHAEPGVFTERTERIIAGFAAQAGIAIDNARLYEVAQKSAQEREHLLASERMARAEAERLSKMKDEFLAMLAHELRNPLAPITTAAEMLKLVSLDKERIRTTSDIITRQVSHMTDLIDDLLDVSRVTRGLVVLQKETIDLKRIAADAIEQVRSLIEVKHQHLVTDIADEALFLVGDRTRLTQILANILNNAAKYTPAHGQISLRLKDHPDQLEVIVEDNGIGISSNLLPHVFDLFTQGERSSDRAQGGLGLGLALVKRLTELHGGAVSAFSRGTGKGSCFSLVFPRLNDVTVEMQAQSQHHEIANQHSAIRMLVVDDNMDAALTLSMMLETIGHKVSVEYTAQAALEKVTREVPKILFLDIGLPEMDGYELARRLRAMPEMAESTLIAVTGYGQQEDIERAAKAGFNHHLVKPVRLESLLNLIK